MLGCTGVYGRLSPAQGSKGDTANDRTSESHARFHPTRDPARFQPPFPRRGWDGWAGPSQRRAAPLHAPRPAPPALHGGPMGVVRGPCLGPSSGSHGVPWHGRNLQGLEHADGPDVSRGAITGRPVSIADRWGASLLSPSLENINHLLATGTFRTWRAHSRRTIRSAAHGARPV